MTTAAPDQLAFPTNALDNDPAAAVIAAIEAAIQHQDARARPLRLAGADV